jgi:hypothetical protein
MQIPNARSAEASLFVFRRALVCLLTGAPGTSPVTVTALRLRPITRIRRARERLAAHHSEVVLVEIRDAVRVLAEMTAQEVGLAAAAACPCPC